MIDADVPPEHEELREEHGQLELRHRINIECVGSDDATHRCQAHTAQVPVLARANGGAQPHPLEQQLLSAQLGMQHHAFGQRRNAKALPERASLRRDEPRAYEGGPRTARQGVRQEAARVDAPRVDATLEHDADGQV